jgi:hypothetical protein
MSGRSFVEDAKRAQIWRAKGPPVGDGLSNRCSGRTLRRRVPALNQRCDAAVDRHSHTGRALPSYMKVIDFGPFMYPVSIRSMRNPLSSRSSRIGRFR